MVSVDMFIACRMTEKCHSRRVFSVFIMLLFISVLVYDSLHKPLLASDGMQGAPSALAFDSTNSPYMFDSGNPDHFGVIFTLRDGKWVQLSYLAAINRLYPEHNKVLKRNKHSLGTLEIDDNDNIYALVELETNEAGVVFALVFSSNGGKNFQAYRIPGKAFLELRTGFNSLNSPPIIGVMKKRSRYISRWTAYHDFTIYIPSIEGGKLNLGEAIHISSKSIGAANHSGGYSFAVSKPESISIVYVETEGKGNPVYLVVLNRKNRRVVSKRLLVDALPGKPNAHVTPVVCVDNAGLLHVMSGSHSGAFYYFNIDVFEHGIKSVSDQLEYGVNLTYAGLVCGKNVISVVYRGKSSLVASVRSKGAWLKPVVLAEPPEGYTGYAVYYHRLFIDRNDNLYVSYNSHNLHNSVDEGRVLLVSRDHGVTWKRLKDWLSFFS